MKLDLRREFSTDEYRCELTRELDILAKLSEQDSYELFYHYIVSDNWCKKENILAIRVPGGTVGSIYINDNNVITKIVVDTEYVVKTYPNNVNELIQKFVGEVIEY
jgi:hypothetical protein